jgi:arylsulfatase B
VAASTRASSLSTLRPLEQPACALLTARPQLTQFPTDRDARLRSHFEGGIRVNAFLSGGLVPVSRRGTSSDALVTLWDWYATLGSIAGLTADQMDDQRAAAAGLPPIDSIDQSAHLLGAAAEKAPRALSQPAPPRTEVPLGSCANARHDAFCQGASPGPTVVSGILVQWTSPLSGVATLAKLLLGWVPLDCTTGPVFPNGTSPVFDEPTHDDLGVACPWKDCTASGCLYNLTADPTEDHDLIGESVPTPGPEIRMLLAHMRARLETANASVFSPDRGTVDLDGACTQAEANGGCWGPWLP